MATPFHFLCTAAGLLALAIVLRLCKRWQWAAGVTMMVVAFVLGGARMRMARQSASAESKEAWPMVQNLAQKAHAAMTLRLEKAGLSHEELHLMQALLWGERQNLSPHTKTLFRRTGSSHLLALSGTHLGIIYGLVYLLCIRWLQHTRWRKPLFLLVMTGIWLYALMCGMPPSLVRAATMLSLHCLARIGYRDMPLLHSLSVAVLVILVGWPMQVLDIGFQLSCLALMWIGLLMKPFRAPYKRWPRPLRDIADLVCISACAQMGTAPLSAYFFHSIPLLGPLFGLAMMPLTTLMMYGGLLALALPHPLIGHMVGACIQLEMQAMELFVRWFPGGMMEHLHPTLAHTLAVYALLLIGCLYVRRKALENGKWE